MKDKIGIAIVALVSILISCVLVAGCTPFPAYITIDFRSEVRQPTFFMYLDPQVKLDIGTIIVWEAPHSSEETMPWEFNSGPVYLPMGWHPRPVESEMMWYLQYEPSDNFFKRLLGGSTSPISSLTYGEVPPGYQEKVKAGALEPERYYIVQMRGYAGRPSEGMTFIIRLGGTGTPERLEYHLSNFLITNPRYPENPRDDFRLY